MLPILGGHINLNLLIKAEKPRWVLSMEDKGSTTDNAYTFQRSKSKPDQREEAYGELK